MTAVEILKKYWGYDGFRPLQAEIVESILIGNDTLGLMPTGGGKSITFQVPAMMLEGVTIVITPLISLMKDQVDNLKRRHIKSVFIHSGMTLKERNAAREKLLNGGAKLLYISPERLSNENFITELRRLRVALIVVDEAHCISQWGYDFRPSYLKIKKIRSVKPDVPVLALTATATEEVAKDICRQLEMKDPQVFKMSFVRSNINYIVRPCRTKIDEVLHILLNTSGTAIVYVRSRKRTGDIAEFLNGAGVSAAAYHAGLSYEIKEERQNRWKRDEVRVMVATNAFGMGIDKPDVRVVIHYDMPPSLEEYYQEAGRAGRDGLNSYAVLLTSTSDKGVLRRRVTENFPDREIIRKVYERICNNLRISLGEGYDTLKEFDFERFCELFNYQPRQCLASIRLLEQAGYLSYMEDADRRSRLMIICEREDLYHLTSLSGIAERVLTAVLREYTGLFAEYVYISESRISRIIDAEETDVYDALLELSRLKIINYIPRSRVPLMYFPTSREEPRYVQIGKDILEIRRDILSARAEAMMDYAFNPSICRENRMLVYFGEKSSCDCGRCDTCRKKKKAKSRNSEEVITEIIRFLKENSGEAEIRIMMHRLHISSRDIAEPLSFLAGENLITINEGYVKLNRQQ